MAMITAFTATPDTVPAGGQSLISVNVSIDPGTPDTTLHVDGTVEETGQQAKVAVTFGGRPAERVAVVLPGEPSQDGATNVRLSLPDGGRLVRQDNQIIFRQA